MPWARLDDSFWRNEKIKAVSNDSLAVYMLAISYSAGELTDGAIDAETLHILCYKRHAQEQTVAAELVKAGLWEDRGDGSYQIHDFLDYNPKREDVLKQRAQSKARQDTWRERHVTNAGDNAERNAVSNAVSNSVPYPVPVPYPDPIPEPKEVRSAVADAPAKKARKSPSEKADKAVYWPVVVAMAEEFGTPLDKLPASKRAQHIKHAIECSAVGWTADDIHTICRRWRAQCPGYRLSSNVILNHGAEMLTAPEKHNGNARGAANNAKSGVSPHKPGDGYFDMDRGGVWVPEGFGA